MAGLNFKQFKAGFFDLKKVRSAADKAHAKVQSKFGAFVRRRMKSSIRYAKVGKERKALLARVRAERAALRAAKAAGDRPGASRARAKLKVFRKRLRALKRPVSEPGKPPLAHRGKSGKSPLRELIFFARDPATNSVVIGPAAFKANGARALEHGGPATVKDPETGRSRTITIRPRPFAKPAGDAEAKNFPALLRSVIN